MKNRDTRNIRDKILGWCPRCERYFRWPVKVHRRHTRYVQHDLNFLCACKECIELDDEYFDALWNDYYSSIW